MRITIEQISINFDWQHHHNHIDLFQSRMAESHGLGLFMAIIFLSGEMAGVRKFFCSIPLVWFYIWGGQTFHDLV